MSKNEEVVTEVPEEAKLVLSPEQQAGSDIITALEAELAQAYGELAHSINESMNRYSQTAQALLAIAYSEYGHPLDPLSSALKKAIDERNEIMAEQEAALSVPES